ncbi:hypothetical protein [uncultured Olsenella sp.]|uniref:hypothetical protein n=1 Tax=uncultured Olsenella sp. TaxID=190764 RepID=UPI0026DD1297|nr:hypothetical protein [uncultured Olsenella sp.]
MSTECDETYHLKTNAHDTEREAELIDILWRIEPGSDHEANHFGVSFDYVQTERQIQEVVTLLTQGICTLCEERG